jgi:hypothetical protein
MKSSPASGTASDTDSEEVFPPSIEQVIPGECIFCKKILYVVEKDPAKVRNNISLDIGPIDEILASDCSAHKALLELFLEDLKLEDKKGVLSIFRPYFSSSFSFHSLYEDDASGETRGHTADMDLLGDNGLGIDLDASWIGEEAALSWYEDCVIKHDKKCSDPQYLQLLPHSRPMYFIDIVDNCLVPAPANVPYAALSYVWGQINMIKATVQNLSHLQQFGALNDPEIQKSLPRTVRHAMHLTGKLKGLKYLWVDALCIIQDDEDMMSHHIPQMGSIYANASIVIVGIYGTDADYGLHGLKSAPEPLPRQITQSTIPFGSKTFVRRHDVGPHRSESSPVRRYFDRGWTFQEHFFSRRCICFENDSVWFQCCSSSRFEDHKHPYLPDHTRDFILDVGYPSITMLLEIVEDFNMRQLSFPQDCLLAFAGTVPCYTKIFIGGFLCGLPEMFIDARLLWQPGGNLVRRVPVYNADKPLTGVENSCLPS